MLLGPDSRLDNEGVEGVRDQGNSHIGLLKSLVESSFIADIEGNGLGVLEALAELLGVLEGSAGYGWERVQLAFWFLIGPGKQELYNLPTVTSTPALLRTSTVGLVT